MLTIAVACDDRPATAPAVVASPNATLLDGTTGGNPRFFFHTPLGNTVTYTGVFNGKMAPTVEVCRTTAQDALGHCTSLLASFTTNGGTNNNGSKVDINQTGQHYSVAFNTKLYTITTNVPFRIAVLLGDQLIGYADVVARSGGKFENATTGVAITLQNGRTLPIKFRIENGVLCGATVNCFEGSVGPEGGTFTVNSADGTRPAGTSFPAGALEDTVNLVIQEITSGECLPTDLQQFRNCYRFLTQPYVPNFALPATVGVCMSEAAGVPYFDDKQLRLWKWSENPGDALLELERVQIDYLICPTVTAATRMRSPMLDRAARVGAWLGRPLAWLLPQPAYAVIGYEGGKLSNFSRIGWVRPIQVSKVQGDNQTGFVSQTLPINPTVAVTNRYGALSQPIVGWRVEFTPSGDGVATPPFTLTGANGQAATAWQLSSTAGANSLRAFVPTSRVIAPAPYEVETIFNANVLAWPSVGWLPPLQNAPGSGTLMLGLNPEVVISEVGGAQIAVLNAVFATTHYAAGWDVPTLDPSKIYRLAIRIYGTTLAYVDLQAVNNELRNVLTGDKVLNLDNSRNLPVKFTVLQ